ncbi:MAG: UvrB/UvrC motif-containing protein [Phycisphaeraceae bacterium]|nr:UvrB/UvrC motif-containing protein [Phycisphaeraceae bacterium]
MKDSKGVVLYVGKAGRLPDRVSSYFVPSADLGPAKQPMLDLVHDFDVLLCDGEWEALLTENRLIKDIRPRFNARLSDDKTFPYLVVTQGEDFPRVLVTREPASPEFRAARVFGPFVSPGSLRDAVALAQRIFRFRTCKLDIVAGDPRNRFFRPCLLHAIGQCTAPCADKVTREAYRADIDRFIRFLSSKRSAMLRELQAEMDRLASEKLFEQAAVVRDQIRAIERLNERASVRDRWQPETEITYIDPKRSVKSLMRALGVEEPIRCIEGFDIAHLMGGETVGSKVCFIDGRPFRDEYRRYRVRTALNDDFASMREVVSRRYREAGKGHELYPDLILIDGGLGQLGAAMDVFEGLTARPRLVVSLAKKEELIFVQGRSEPIRLGRDNPGLRLLQQVRDEAHRFAQHYHHVLRRKRTLGE